MLEHDLAVCRQAIKRACPHKVFKQPFIDRTAIDARCKIGQVPERTIGLALRHKAFHCRITNVAHGRQCITDFAHPIMIFDRKRHLRIIDAGRQDFDAKAFDLLLENRKFFGVVHIKRHQRGHEFDRIIRLEIRCLIRHQRIGRRVRFVKAIGCELGDLIKDVGRLPAWHPVLFRPVNKQRALQFHFLGDLFTHRTTQKVCTAKRIARHRLGKLHDLFLIDHDAIGFFEDRLQHRVHVIRLFQTMLTCDVMRDIVHRPRTIQRHDRDDIFNRIGLKPAQNILHALGFKLEHTDRLGRRKQLERHPIIKGNGTDIKVLRDVFSKTH